MTRNIRGVGTYPAPWERCKPPGIFWQELVFLRTRKGQWIVKTYIFYEQTNTKDTFEKINSFKPFFQQFGQTHILPFRILFPSGLYIFKDGLHSLEDRGRGLNSEDTCYDVIIRTFTEKRVLYESSMYFWTYIPVLWSKNTTTTFIRRKHWQNLRICKIEVGFEKFVFHTQHTHLVQAYHVCRATKWKEEIVYFTFFQARKHVRLSLFPLGIHNGMFQNANLPFLEEKKELLWGE